MMTHGHPQAQRKARELVSKHDGSAGKLVENELAARIDEDKIEEALHLDQVRREIGKIYEDEGK